MALLRTLCAALLVASLAGACGGGTGGSQGDAPPGAPARPAADDAVPVVVDTDLALDDVVALAFLLSSPEVDVRAVTVSGTGEVRCPQGLRVISSLLDLTGDEDVPVACGRATPLAGDHAFPTEWRDAADGGWGMDLTGATESPPDRSATELLRTVLGDAGVTVLTLGPLTNVAEAFRAEPALAEQVASIVIMGGALDVPGNVGVAGTEEPTAEWNIYVDPSAAAEVLASGAPVVLVGLDATDRLPITGEFLERLGANSHTRPAGLVDMLIRNNPQVYTGEAFFWDPLAAAVVVDPELVATEQTSVTVLTAEGPDIGRTVRRDDGSQISVAGRPRAAAFEDLLLRTLEQLGPDDALAVPPPPVGEATIRYDGSTCRYDGPVRVRTGRMRFSFTTSEPAWTGGVAALTGERSIEQILGWLRARPESLGGVTVPGVAQVTPVPAGFTTYVDVAPPSVAVICAADAPVPLVARTVVVR